MMMRSLSSRSALFLGVLMLTISSLFHGDTVTTRYLAQTHGLHHDKKDFFNWHLSLTVGGSVERFFFPSNGVSGNWQSDEFQTGFDEIRAILTQATSEGKRVRAYGSKWASSDIAYVDEFSVESWSLNYLRLGLDDVHVTAAYSATRERLAFVQSGVMVKHLQEALFDEGLTLPTSGNGAGQRIAGVMATGSHGSANSVGPVTVAVRGIHMLTNSETVYIQKSSDVVVNQDFVNSIGGGRIIADDDMFKAAVVHLGSFGIVHGLVLEAVPLYKLRMQQRRMSFDSVRPVLASFSGFDTLGFEGITDVPFHFEVNVDPYKKSKNRKSALVRVGERVEMTERERKSVRESGHRSGAATQSMHESLAAATIPLSGLSPIKWIKRTLFSFALQIGMDVFFGHLHGPTEDFPSVWFLQDNNDLPKSNYPIASLGTEVAVPRDRILDLIDIATDIMFENPLPCPLSVRFVKSSDEFMAVARFGDITATMELACVYDGFFFQQTPAVHKELLDTLVSRGIPHAFHFGQSVPRDDEWVSRSYGSGLVQWQQQRNLLLDAAGQNMFSSNLLEDLAMV